MVTLYLTFHWKSVKRPFCPAGKMSCFYFVLDHLHIPLYLFSSWGKHTDVYQDLYFKWPSYIQFPMYVYYVTSYEFDNLMTNFLTHLLRFGTQYPAWVAKFCHKFSEWWLNLNESIVPSVQLPEGQLHAQESRLPPQGALRRHDGRNAQQGTHAR